jgi:hypothetical protein
MRVLKDPEEIPEKEVSEEIVIEAAETRIGLQKCIKLPAAIAVIHARYRSNRQRTNRFSAVNVLEEIKVPVRILKNPMNNWK